jgi:hypothetical protein
MITCIPTMPHHAHRRSGLAGLAVIAQQVIEQSRPWAAREAFEPGTDPALPLFGVLAAPAKQALLNVVGNATKYADAKKDVQPNRPGLDLLHSRPGARPGSGKGSSYNPSGTVSQPERIKSTVSLVRNGLHFLPVAARSLYGGAERQAVRPADGKR